MKEYIVSMNGHKINVIVANSEEAALEKAVYLYGLTVDIQEKETK